MPTRQAHVRRLVAVATLAIAGCAGRPTVDDLQGVYGPSDVRFQQRELRVDLNDDGVDDRIVLLANHLRGLRLPQENSELNAGVIVDGFAVFDGRHPTVPVFYQYTTQDGFQLRLDEVDGQQLLVADGGRDHVQSVWGWWRYSEAWPPSGWQARQRKWEESAARYGKWQPAQPVMVVVAK